MCPRLLTGNPLNTDTPIIRTFWRVPLVSVLTGFHCTTIDRMHDDVTCSKGSMVVVVTLKSEMADVVLVVGEIIKIRIIT